MSEHSPSGIPNHVAIIMDGNGRWAEKRGLPRTAGHIEGIEALRRTVGASIEAGIKYLTIYSFSTENWSRPATEVGFLMGLLKRFIQEDVAKLHEVGVRVKVIGSRENLTSDILKLLEGAENLTKSNSVLTLVVAFNYGSKQELARACQKLLASGVKDVTPELIQSHLDTADIPDPDLLIRTGGETRMSNFLLWQSAYTELLFSPEFWPDFNKQSLQKAIAEFQSRERRFGGLKSKAS